MEAHFLGCDMVPYTVVERLPLGVVKKGGPASSL